MMVLRDGKKTQRKQVTNYKFAIILNDVYYYYNGSSTTVVGINEGGLSGNTVIDK